MPLETSTSWSDMDPWSFSLYSSLFILGMDFLLYPTELIATRMQASTVSVHAAARTRVVNDGEWGKEDGCGHLSAGWPQGYDSVVTGRYGCIRYSAAIGSFPGQFLYYAAYEKGSAVIDPLLLRMRVPQGVSPFLSCSVAGFLAEAVSAFAYLPCDIVVQRLQVHSMNSFLHLRHQHANTRAVIRHVYRSEGVRGFFRGYWAYVATYGPSSAIWWLGYEGSRALLGRLAADSWTKREADILVSGCVAGTASAVFINPLEVAKTRLQLMEAGHDKGALSAGFRSLLGSVHRLEGWRGLMRGLGLRLLFRVPGGAVTMLGYEYIKDLSRASSPPPAYC